MNWMAFSTVEWISVNALVMANVKSTPNKNTTRYFQPDVREISFFFIAKRKDLKNHSIKKFTTYIGDREETSVFKPFVC